MAMLKNPIFVQFITSTKILGQPIQGHISFTTIMIIHYKKNVQSDTTSFLNDCIKLKKILQLYEFL